MVFGVLNQLKSVSKMKWHSDCFEEMDDIGGNVGLIREVLVQNLTSKEQYAAEKVLKSC